MVLHVEERGQFFHVQFLETVVHIQLEDEVGEILLRFGCRSLHLGTEDVGTALAVERRGVVSQVAQHVEHVALFHLQEAAHEVEFFFLEARLLQQVEQLLAGLGSGPALAQVVCTVKELGQLAEQSFDIFLDGDEFVAELHPFLPMGLQQRQAAQRREFHDNGILLAWAVTGTRQVAANRARLGRRWRRALTRNLAALGARLGLRLVAGAWIVAAHGAEGVTVPLGVLEILGRAHEVVEREEIFPVKQAGAATHNLLELDNVIDGTHQHDVAHIAGIDACRELLRRGQDSGAQQVVVLEHPEHFFALVAIVGGDALTVVTVGHLLVLVDHRRDFQRMSLSVAEDDGLLVGTDFVQQLHHTMLVALTHVDAAVVEVLLGIGLVHLYLAHNAVIGVVGVVIDVAGGEPHAVRRQEAVLDALLEGVTIDGLAEVVVGIGVDLATRRGRHAQLHGGLKPVHQLAPLTLVVGAATVALVDNHEVKEIVRPLLVVWRITAFRTAHDSLEDGKIQVTRRGQFAAQGTRAAGGTQAVGGDALHSVLVKLLKVVLGLVRQDVAVSDEQDARLLRRATGVPVGLVQFPADLEGGVGLARARCHGEQDALFVVGDGIQHGVDGDFLIVAGLAAAATVQGTQVELVAPFVLLGVGHLPQFLRRGELIHKALGGRDDIVAIGVFHAHVNLPDLVAVGGVSKADVQQLGIEFRLGDALGITLLVALGLDDRQFFLLVLEDVVSLLRVFVLRKRRHHARGDIRTLLHEDFALRHLIPADVPQRRVNLLHSGCRLIHILFKYLS